MSHLVHIRVHLKALYAPLWDDSSRLNRAQSSSVEKSIDRQCPAIREEQKVNFVVDCGQLLAGSRSTLSFTFSIRRKSTFAEENQSAPIWDILTLIFGVIVQKTSERWSFPNRW